MGEEEKTKERGSDGGGYFDTNRRLDATLSLFGFDRKYAGRDELVRSGTREDRYQVKESYEVGRAPTNHENSHFPCFKRTMYSFIQGTFTGLFVATPLSALHFAFAVAPKTPTASLNTASLLSAGAAGGVHWGLLYGFYMGGFRGSSCAARRFGIEEGPISVGACGGIGGGVAAVASARYRAPARVAAVVTMCSLGTASVFAATQHARTISK